MNAREKGKAGEREAAHFLSDLFGIPAHRGQQHKGGSDSPDVIIDLPIHWEVKRCERLVVDNAIDQAVRDAPSDKIPAVLHRRNRSQWLFTIRGIDIKQLGGIMHQEELKNLRHRFARLEGAARRIMDALGKPVDGRDGTDSTADAISDYADNLVNNKPEQSWKF